MLEALLLATVLVTVTAIPGWQRLRMVLVALWLVSMAGTPLSVLAVRPGLWQWYRTIELLTLAPVLGVVAASMLVFVRRQPTLTVDVIFATVGYGDVLPATHIARMLAMVQAVLGLFCLAVMVALFVGTYSSQRRGETKGGRPPLSPSPATTPPDLRPGRHPAPAPRPRKSNRPPCNGFC